jgi:hypothetical protein
VNDALRGLVLLLSVLLWLPVLRPVVDGGMEVTQGALLYLAALGIAWAGVAGLHALVRGYVRAGEAAAEQASSRRADDVRS